MSQIKHFVKKMLIFLVVHVAVLDSSRQNCVLFHQVQLCLTFKSKFVDDATRQAIRKQDVLYVCKKIKHKGVAS